MFLALLFSSSTAFAMDAPTEKPPRPRFRLVEATDLTPKKEAENFGVLYLGQWASYPLTQHAVIKRTASFHNWTHYPFRPHFDKDSFDYNLYKHTIAGSAYFLYYRARGYSRPQAMIWSVASSLAFEFTIETLTERPSFQDIYQTPIYGTVAGMGLEYLSLYFHSLGGWPARALGYLFNPFTLLPGNHYHFEAMPTLGGGPVGASVSMRF